MWNVKGFPIDEDRTTCLPVKPISLAVGSNRAAGMARTTAATSERRLRGNAETHRSSSAIEPAPWQCYFPVQERWERRRPLLGALGQVALGERSQQPVVPRKHHAIERAGFDPSLRTLADRPVLPGDKVEELDDA